MEKGQKASNTTQEPTGLVQPIVDQLGDLLRSATTDHLTGLSNRWSCAQQVNRGLQEGRIRVFYLLDYKHFKEVNTLFGSEVGDELLVAVSQVLRAVFPHSVIARLGGNEFAIAKCEEPVSDEQFTVFVQELFTQLSAIKVSAMGHYKHSYALAGTLVDADRHHTFEGLYQEVDGLLARTKTFEGSYAMTPVGGIPDIVGVFYALRSDRHHYNALNDQLFRITDKEVWFDYLNKSAGLKEDMCQRNQNRLKQLKTYYSRKDVQQADYELLYRLCHQFHSTLDPFIVEDLVGRILLPYYESLSERTPEVRSHLMLLYLYYGDSLYSISQMGDRDLDRPMDETFQKVIELGRETDPADASFDYYLYSICHLLGHFENYDDGRSEKRDRFFEEMVRYVDRPFVDKAMFEHFRYLTMNSRNYPMLRACLLGMKKHRTPDEEAELRRKIEYVRQHTTPEGYLDTCPPAPMPRLMSQLQVQHLLRLNEPMAQFELDMKMYYGFIQHLPDVILSEHITLFTYLLLMLLDSLDRCPFTDAERRQYTVDCWDTTIILFKHRKNESMDQQSGMLSNFMSQFVLALPYLTQQDKSEFLIRSMGVLTLDTYAHSKAMAAYARLITGNIVDRFPELLVGSLPELTDEAAVQANKELVLNFIYQACIFHDLGKLLQVPIVSNSYRKLTDHEFRLLRRHPYLGVEILNRGNIVDPLSDIIMGHHKWYNGQGGYPESYDNTQSKARILTDIVCICDTIEAATCRIGRNYRKAKSFCVIFDELFVESGTRYNPDVIHTITSSRQLAIQIRNLIENDWPSFYRQIYQEVVE